MSDDAEPVSPSDKPEPNSGNWRLENQIAWYDRKAQAAQKNYRSLRAVQIVITALVPVSALIFHDQALIPGILGAMVLIAEGWQELGAFHRNWTKYRATCEALRHEKFLFLGGAGPYEGLDSNEAMKELVQRVEALISTEHAHWIKHMESQRAENDRARRERAKS